MNERLRMLWWKMGLRRCGCGKHRIAKGTRMQLAGYVHLIDGQCFRCDDYGQPVP